MDEDNKLESDEEDSSNSSKEHNGLSSETNSENVVSEKSVPEIRYKNFLLDKFQIDAINSIKQNNSVVVSAATGTGKTLIADYIISEAIAAGRQVIYTSPIKALSNQKYREFHESYGDKVGLLTGDVSVNPSAPILVMTTEIYRNMLLEKEPLDNLSYVIFDEIHYINDIERGTVWEESLIFSPKSVRFLCLSATIPNYVDFASWISKIKGHDVDTVNYMKRAVPLKHEIFDYRLGVCSIDDIKKDQVPDYYDRFKGRNNHGKGKQKKSQHPAPNFVELIKELRMGGDLPCIFFSFSRRDAFEKAEEMGRRFDYTDSFEKKAILEFLRKEIPESIADMQSVKAMRQFLSKGFAVHHAGILPKMKEIVEQLFAKGWIKVLFATETFAVGINMPAKTVVLNSIKKYDGYSTRYLSTKEYFQMAGRAGRRGIDDHGRVAVIVNRNDLDLDELARVTSDDVEPIISRFTISYNTVLNLVKNHKKSERDVILKSNFGFFQKKGNQNRVDQGYINYLHVLNKMGYIQKQDIVDEDGNKKGEDYVLNWKGAFATHIFSHELVLSELYYSKIMPLLTDNELLVFITALEYESRMSDEFDDDNVDITPIINKISINNYVLKHTNKKALKSLYKLVSFWADGKSFDDILNVCSLAEGDIIRLFRRIIDNLKQIRSAIVDEKDEEMAMRLSKCIEKLDRDLVKVIL